MIAIIESTVARTMSCRALTSVFEPGGADVATKQAYAHCIDFLYPPAMDARYAIVLKVMFCVLVLMVFVGAWTVPRTNNVGNTLASAVIGAIVAPIITALVFMIGIGIFSVLRWVFAL
jgi:hypothetical protein